MSYHLTRYLNSNSNYSIIFRDHNWKNIEGQDLDTDRTESNAGHNIRETKAIIAAFARHKLTADFPANLDYSSITTRLLLLWVNEKLPLKTVLSRMVR